MCIRVLTLLALQMGFACCFNWDIIVSEGKQLNFYNNGTLTHTEDIPSTKEIYSVTYDPVQNRVLFADDRGAKHEISSFDLTTRKIQLLVTRTEYYKLFVAYDPVTQLLFWQEGLTKLYSFSLMPASPNKTGDVNLIVTLNKQCQDIAVDSCGGYIYWITDNTVERARFDGSERRVLTDIYVWGQHSLAIDHQTQKIYWTEKHQSAKKVAIKSAGLNGENKITMYIIKTENEPGSLTISNDYIYWNGYTKKAIWKLPKNHPQQLEEKIISNSKTYWYFQVIAPNYKIKEQLKGNQNCEALKSLIPKESEPDCKDVLLCVHGTKVPGKSRCDCTRGYTGEKCDISICQNYCLQGNCSISAEGQPKCSCKAGYSEERCEVYACHKHCLNSGICSLNDEDEPVCECTADYGGERCELPTCQDNYCVSAKGKTKSRSNGGNYGEKQVSACHQYCLNNGVCSLNEEDQPVCQCTADYEGERCDVPVFLFKCFLYAYKNFPPRRRLL